MSQTDIVHQSFAFGWYSVLVCYVSQLRNIQLVDFYQYVLLLLGMETWSCIEGSCCNGFIMA